MDQNATRLYLLAVEDPAWTFESASAALNLATTEVQVATAELVKRHLLRAADDDAGGFVVSPPDVAVATLLDDDARQLQELQLAIAERRGELLALEPLYREARRQAATSAHIEVLDDPELVTTYLTEASRDVTREVLMVQPAPVVSVERARSSVKKDLELLAKGVARRTLRRDKDRDHPPTRYMADETVGAGAETRTLPSVPVRAMIFDRSTALLSSADHWQENYAIVIREPRLVATMARVFDAVWEGAVPMDGPAGETEPAAAGRLSAAQQSVLDGMALGLTDEAIASRLGISVRTCRRHIAAILEEFGVETRFQAGIAAANRGLIRSALLR